MNPGSAFLFFIRSVVQNPVMSLRTPSDEASLEEIRRLAHDLNNHLGVIRNHAELLEDALRPGQERDDVAEIQTAVTKAAAVVQRLLAIGRGSA